ncbi:hypothetical protein [Terasakiispira papahanaumokuakeensis]|uniref:hypothetical protein n=1 Tax=Terasakiispira papahanaumokuakeensis TaxID=197479 RepID=UPI000A74DE38|nr:hypothetical protein [Terasakiispira papahanaumokuakeensis]
MYIYRLILMLVFAGYLLSPLMLNDWGESAWYRPFLIWAGLIAITIWLEQKRKLDEL